MWNGTRIYKFQIGWDYSGHFDRLSGRDFKYIIETILQESGCVVSLKYNEFNITLVKKNNKIPLTSVKTLIRTKSDRKTKKQQTEIAQTKIWKNIRTLWDGNKTKPRTKAVAARA